MMTMNHNVLLSAVVVAAGAKTNVPEQSVFFGFIKKKYWNHCWNFLFFFTVKLRMLALTCFSFIIVVSVFTKVLEKHCSPVDMFSQHLSYNNKVVDVVKPF